MTIMTTHDNFKLASGSDCSLIRIRNDLIPHYYLLAFPKSQGEPSPAETREMITKGIACGQSLAMDLLRINRVRHHFKVDGCSATDAN